MTIIDWCVFALRNVVIGSKLATAVATRVSSKDPLDASLVDAFNVLQVDILVPRSWQVKAGEYIFLSLPNLGFSPDFEATLS